MNVASVVNCLSILPSSRLIEFGSAMHPVKITGLSPISGSYRWSNIGASVCLCVNVYVYKMK